MIDLPRNKCSSRDKLGVQKFFKKYGVEMTAGVDWAKFEILLQSQRKVYIEGIYIYVIQEYFLLPAFNYICTNSSV